GDIQQALIAAFTDANQQIFKEKQKEQKNESMACVLTCAIADVKNNKLYFAHVGDTRLYLLRDQSLVKITKDHSAVGFLEESGRLSEADAMRHPRRNEINKALGFEATINNPAEFIETGESPFLPGDTILLCSDGLTDMVTSQLITDILTEGDSLQTKAARLVDAANAAGGNDNITAVLVQNTRQSLQQATTYQTKEAARQDTTPALKANAKASSSKKKSNNGLVILLSLLCLALTAALIYPYLIKQNKSATIATPVVGMLTKSVGLLQLQSAIKDTPNVFALTMQEQNSITINDSILVARDSFLLIGNGVILKSDSTYTGPAFIINNVAKQIILDSLVFENFDRAIVASANNIVLRNVRFINCRIPLQYNILLKDSLINGRPQDLLLPPNR
ncbi:MAG: protein phosphatase 2C domain-containing protein, partial [Ferruginibacter sp.]